MYVVMKEGKYFTGEVSHQEDVSFLWTRWLSDAKVWKQKRAWAKKAADRWGGEVVELTPEGQKVENLAEAQ